MEDNNENGYAERESSISQLGSASVRNGIIAQLGKAAHKFVKLNKTPSTEYHRADTSFDAPPSPNAINEITMNVNVSIFSGNEDCSPDARSPRSIAGDERSVPKNTA